MANANAPKIIKSVQGILTRYGPEILTGVGVAGMITTTVLAVKATPKALLKIEEKKREENLDYLTPLETVKATWKCYIPTVITGATSIACIIGASSAHAKRNAALAAACKISETAFLEYRDKVVETIGEKKEQAVKEAIVKDSMEKNPVSKSSVIVTHKGDTLFYDKMSCRYFMSDIDKVKKAENELNKRMLDELYISLNEFYDEIGLPPIGTGDIVGWNVNKNMIDLCIGSDISDDGRPCITIDHNTAPFYGYERYY